MYYNMQDIRKDLEKELNALQEEISKAGAMATLDDLQAAQHKAIQLQYRVMALLEMQRIHDDQVRDVKGRALMMCESLKQYDRNVKAAKGE
jgi:hypothetical protein